MYTTQFKVVTVSENTNNFGLKQCIMIAKSGVAYKVCANSLNIPKRGDVLEIPAILDAGGNPTKNYSFAGRGFELPEQIEHAPQDVVDEVWK